MFMMFGNWPEQFAEDLDDSSEDAGSANVEELDSQTNLDSVSLSTLLLPREKMFGEKIYEEMGNFFNSVEFSDVDVKVGSEVFKCHKIILASWSSYFRGLFSSGMTEMQLGVVELITIKPEEFRDILKMMYTGHFEVMGKNLQGILYAASYLQMTALEDKCVEFILNTLHKSRRETLQYLKISRQLNLKVLSEGIMHYICNRFEQYQRCSDLWESLSFEDIRQLLDTKCLCSSEDEICMAMLKWIDTDVEGRRLYVKDLINQLRYLTLSTAYMRNSFLEHKVVKDNTDLEEVRAKCLEYLSKPSLQFEYIGELEASHRPEHELTDVICVCYPTKIEFLRHSEREGTFNFAIFAESENKELKDSCQNITACNAGRSDIILSTGKNTYLFDGIKLVWSSGPTHLIRSKNNCLLFDHESDNVYSVVVTHDMVFIERCKYDRGNRSIGAWDIELQQAMINDSENKIHSDTRTCAYMVDGNIFFLKQMEVAVYSGASVFRYMPVTKSLGVISRLPIPQSCSVAVSYKDIVFLVDNSGKNILKVSENGTCIDKYGEIEQNRLRNEFEEHTWRNFGACIYKGKLIIAGGINGGSISRENLVAYDLSAHVATQCIPSLKQMDAVCLKLTISPQNLKWDILRMIDRRV